MSLWEMQNRGPLPWSPDHFKALGQGVCSLKGKTIPKPACLPHKVSYTYVHVYSWFLCSFTFTSNQIVGPPNYLTMYKGNCSYKAALML